MKILAIADRPPRKKVKEIIKENPDIEIIFLLGDLTIFDLEGLQDITHIPKIGIYGNHCSGNYFEKFGIINLHLTTFEYKGIIFGGFEGSVRYKNDPYAKMYTQEEAFSLMDGFPYVDVMLTHCPPYGVNDEPEELAHQGFKALSLYLDEKMPKYLFHGHTYPTNENIVKRYKNTNIVYVYEDNIIDIL
jgi:Icc-related predicted phosphoesterase